MSRTTAIFPWCWRSGRSAANIFPVLILLALPACILLSGCAEKKSQLELIQERSAIHVVTQDGPTTYQRNGEAARGLEYELVRLFAGWLGVDVKLTLADSREEIIDRLAGGQADFAAAGLARTFNPEDPLSYGPGFQWATRQVVYRHGYIRPSSLGDISPNKLHVARHALLPEDLGRLRVHHPDLELVVHDDKNSFELLEMVEYGKILYCVAGSNEVVHARISLPELRVAFDLTHPEPLGWAVRRSPNDDSLIRKIRQFHDRIRGTGQLAGLLEQAYAFAHRFDYVEARSFIDRYNEALPELKPYFESAANEFDMDWRLLAAVSYQESHWKKSARSPTGVRGLMMLTLETAQQVGISDRLDPVLSIHGGARYLTTLVNKIPERIPEPDRTWFALASYNVGFGHLEDARVLTEKNGGDPDSWVDVKKTLPLLSQHKWYSQTRHGHARGGEPVKFVENIRKYTAMLVHLTYAEAKPAPATVVPEAPAVPEIPRLPEHVISSSPVL